MAQKIATVSTVFAACDRLEAANERWNREDVRNAVGGGGYVVIDPLIRAWRELKPLREAAPTTPAELLHQIATTLESHITEFIEETESQQVESQKIFDATVSDLSERLATLEGELEERDVSLQAMAEGQTRLTDQLEDSRRALEVLKVANAQLLTENDGLRGQLERVDGEHKETIATLNVDAKESAKIYASERSRASTEHAAALTAQRQEMTEAAEQTENRLMRLLDQERQMAKESAAQLTSQLKEMRDNDQSNRERVIELEAMMRNLTDENGRLESVITGKTAECTELSTALEQQQAHAALIQREFEGYKEEHKISGDLEALQAAVAALQARLEGKQDE